MGPDKDSSTPPKNQDTRGTPGTPGTFETKACRRRARRPRSRACLLKGCERVFRPQQPLTRYCSEACREQARRWREWKARRRYRQSADGKQKRQAQSRRYRERRKEALRERAREMAARAVDEGEMELEPMNAFERKIVHDAVGEIAGVTSFSEGEEPYRRVVIAPDE